MVQRYGTKLGDTLDTRHLWQTKKEAGLVCTHLGEGMYVLVLLPIRQPEKEKEQRARRKGSMVGRGRGRRQDRVYHAHLR